VEDSLGDRMKMLEQAEAGRRCLPLLPICVRLDGKSFHAYTEGLKRPFDERFSNCMVDTTKFLVEESNACIGYTQSDEISLVLYSPAYESPVFFDGKIQKLASVLCSMATACFNQLALLRMPPVAKFAEYSGFGLCRPLAFFDCRVWTVPILEEAANAILWREIDCTKNSVSMAARTLYGHEELVGKTGSEMQEMMFAKGVNWNDYPTFFKRGTYVQQKMRASLKTLAPEKLAEIPERHRPTGPVEVERMSVVTLDMPPFARIVNRVGVMFRGEDPQVEAIANRGGRPFGLEFSKDKERHG